MSKNKHIKWSWTALLVAALALTLVMVASADVRALDSNWRSPNWDYYSNHAYDANDAYSQDGWEARIGEYDDYTGSVYYSFGNSFVPANAYITGIEVRIDCYCPSDDTRFYVNLYDNGVLRGSTYFYTPQSESNNYSYLGGAWNNWGYAGWTPAKINTSNFRIQVANWDDDEYVLLDHLQVKIHYTIGHVVTNAPTDITNDSATISGFYDSFSEPNHANLKGLEYWNTAGGPVTSLFEATTEDSGTMLANLSSLTSNSQYAVKAGAWYTASPGDLILEDNVTYGGTHYFNTKPESTTLTATSVISRSATLNGYMDPEGSLAVSNGFYISAVADTAEELKVLPLQLGTPGEGNFTKSVTGLLPETTYYYMAATYNFQSGVQIYGYGEVMSFTTPPDPPAVTAHPANRTITYGANTTFTATANGKPAPAVAWQVSADAGTTWAAIDDAIYSVNTVTNEETRVVTSTLTLTRPTVSLNGCRYRALFINWVAPTGVASNAASLTVNKANASVTVNGWSGVYDNSYHGATLGTATGVGGENLADFVTVSSTAYKNVTGGLVPWSFSNPNYNPLSGNAVITITRANATIAVNGWSGVYDTTSHGATLGSAVGVGGEDLAGSVTISDATFINVPGGTVAWSFNNPNYNAQSGNATISITRASATITVDGWSGVYDNSPHTATLSSATGVGGENLSSSVHIDATLIKDVPGGQVNWSFSNPNYIPQVSSATISITPAIASVDVRGWAGEFDGFPHGATLVLAIGVGGEDINSSVNIDPVTYRDVPGGSASWSLNNSNYGPLSGSVMIEITKAPASIMVNGWIGVYDGAGHGAEVFSATGAGGEDLSSFVNIGPAIVKDVPGGSVDWFFDHLNYISQTGSAQVLISPADASIVVNGWGGVYDGAYHGATLQSATGAGGEDLTGSVMIDPTIYRDVPGGLVGWSFANPNYNPQSGLAAIEIGKADATIVVTGWNGVYDGFYHRASLETATGVYGEDLSSFVSIRSESYRNVPGGSTSWTFSSPNYNLQSGSATISIAPADASITVDGWSGIYNGKEHGATLASAVGVGGEDLSSFVSIGSETYKDVPGGSVSWSFSRPNYNPQSGNVNVSIAPAAATIVVDGWDGVYDGEYHTATVNAATGAGSEDLRAFVYFSINQYKNVPGGIVTWSFHTPNYISQYGKALISIAPATASIAVNGWNGVYDGDEHGATLASAVGVGGEDLSGSVILDPTTYRDVPGGSAGWSFSHQNYNTQSGSVAIEIARAPAIIVVNGWKGIYDGNGHGATLASATGVNGEDLSPFVMIDPDTYKDVPGGSVGWSFSNPNYIPQSSTAAIEIGKADATIVVRGWNGMYDRCYHGATLENAIGVGGEDLSGSVNVDPATFKDVPGGFVDWSFGNINYNPKFGSVEIAIDPADAVIGVDGWSGVYDGANHGATLSAAFGIGGEDLSGSVSIDPVTYRDVPGGLIGWSFRNINYNPQSGNAPVLITPAAAMIIVDGWSGIYDAADHGASLNSSTGVNGENLSGDVIVGKETYKDVPGGLVGWSFSNPNYISQEGSASIDIRKADLTVTALDHASQYSDALQALTYQMTGFVGGENAGVVSGLPVLDTAADQSSPAGTYAITVDVTGLTAVNYNFIPVSGTYTIRQEDVVVTFENTLTSQLVATPGGSAPQFGLTVDFSELLPDVPSGSAAAGDIRKIIEGIVKITLTPVGPGSSYTISSATIAWNLESGYDGVASATVTFPAGLPVNTYEVKVELLGNNYYLLGSNATVFTIYDPSLGFTTGGGWFYWPGSADEVTGYPGDKTNFGYTMQYGKNGTNLKGSLLMIRHLRNGDTYRIKSNALDAGSLALGTTTLPMGWASFSGKCNFTAIISGVETTVGNVQFRVYVEDRNDPGTLADRIWIEVTGQAALTMPDPSASNAVSINGGNIFVPHVPAKRR